VSEKYSLLEPGPPEGKIFKERSFLQDIPVLSFQIQAGIFYQEGRMVEVLT